MNCDAGIWSDCKQLLPHTRRLVASFNEFDREVVGKELLRLNVAMIRDFALAYRLRDERFVYDERQTIGKALAAAKRKGVGNHRYIDSINSYLGLIKGTSDLRQARAVLDAVRPGFTKDYTNYKIAI